MGTKIVASHDEARVIGQQVPGVSLRTLEDGSLELFFPDELAAAVDSVNESDQRPVLYAYAAAVRWNYEVGGITVNGMAVPTDERTQGVLTGARIKANADPNYQITNWKSGFDQYVSLDAAALIAISDTVAAHIQECFTVNATVDAAISAGSITTQDEIDAAFAAALASG